MGKTHKKVRYARVSFLRLLFTFPLLLAFGGLLPPDAAAQTVPKTECGPNDRVETGLQGQTTKFERDSGLSELGFNCNLELVGQFQGDGSQSWHMAWFDNCAYYPTPPNPELLHQGTVVVDASDPRNPHASAYLDTPAMRYAWESLKVHKGRKLLAATERFDRSPRTPHLGTGFDIYDLSADCRHPVLKASIQLAGSGDPFRAVQGHAGNFTPDGLTYYASQDFRGLRGIMPIIDVSDPSNPKQLLNWQFPGDGRPHDPSFSKDGTRLYSGQPGQFGNTGSSIGPNGLVILDVSDIQFRRPNPQISVISTLFWEDGGQSQQTLGCPRQGELRCLVTIQGRPHLIFTDEAGAGGTGGTAGACARGVPPHGFARIIDISDERNPKTISKLMLEVDDPANCPVILSDPPGPGFALSYSSHYCNVDKVRNPKLLACTYQGAGLRVFDIRDPFHPREIAYYKPPARRTAFLPGSRLWAPGVDRTTDHTASQVRFKKYKGEMQIWFASADNGFQIVRFTRHFKAIEEDLLEDRRDRDDEDDDD